MRKSKIWGRIFHWKALDNWLLLKMTRITMIAFLVTTWLSQIVCWTAIDFYGSNNSYRLYNSADDYIAHFYTCWGDNLWPLSFSSTTEIDNFITTTTALLNGWIPHIFISRFLSYIHIPIVFSLIYRFKVFNAYACCIPRKCFWMIGSVKLFTCRHQNQLLRIASNQQD